MKCNSKYPSPCHLSQPSYFGKIDRPIQDRIQNRLYLSSIKKVIPDVHVVVTNDFCDDIAGRNAFCSLSGNEHAFLKFRKQNLSIFCWHIQPFKVDIHKKLLFTTLFKIWTSENSGCPNTEMQQACAKFHKIFWTARNANYEETLAFAC